ncbi:hypothetical protein RYX36_023847 [Vicia faba]
MPTDHVTKVSTKPPHPDAKYISQVISLPKENEWSDFVDQEWLFDNNHSQEKTRCEIFRGYRYTAATFVHALVQAAAQLHMIFFNKSGNILEVKFNTTILQYEVLETLEFTSNRKRMSVVLKDCQNGNILLLSKGADEAILPYARAGQQTRHFIEVVEQYAHLGLRTLCLAWRELKKDEYQDWSLMFK